MKFSVSDFFSKCDQIHRKLRIWSHLLEKSLIENFLHTASRMDSCDVVETIVFSLGMGMGGNRLKSSMCGTGIWGCQREVLDDEALVKAIS